MNKYIFNNNNNDNNNNNNKNFLSLNLANVLSE